MSLRQRGKERAGRIDLDYYRRRTWLSMFRGIAAATGLIVAILYGAWVLVPRERNAIPGSSIVASNLSTGPLALVHAHLQNDCQKCHSEQLGVALAHDAWQANAADRLQLLQTKCQDCHRVDGHATAMLAREELDRDCARCHREHSGKATLLAKVENRVCTNCHGNLKGACREGVQTQLRAEVADFSIQSHSISAPAMAASDGKPADGSAAAATFRSLLKDRGRVRFDHAQHILPGQVDPGSKGGFQLSMLSPAQRQVYARSGQAESDLVQLKCSSCHVPYAIQEPQRTSAIAREEGRFYAPINFEKHCAACHQMNFAGQTPDELPLPHVAQREEFARLLSAKQFAGARGGKVTMPGDEAFRAQETEPSAGAHRAIEFDREGVDAAVDAVFMRCRQCHAEEDTQHEAIAQALAGTLEPLIPRCWLQRGYFDHAAHAHITRCAYCHPMPTGVGPPNDNNVVMIKGPESCVPCHRAVDAEAPPEFATEAKRIEALGQEDQPTWASNECITCHRYHWSRTAASSSQSHFAELPPGGMLTGESSSAANSARLP
ncbi:MAG: cytochrome c3 family protein [Aureliella sp.]